MNINLLLTGARGNISWWRNHPLPTAAPSTPCPEGGAGKKNIGTTGPFLLGTGDILFDTLPEAICSRISNLPLRLLHTKLEHVACTWPQHPALGVPASAGARTRQPQRCLPALTVQVVQAKASRKFPSEKLALLEALSHCEWGGEKRPGSLAAGMKWGRNTKCTNRKTLPCRSSLPQLLPARLKPCPEHAHQQLSILKPDGHQGHSAHLTIKPFFPGAVTKGASCASTDYP